MWNRLFRALSALFVGSLTGYNPIKVISTIVISVLIPYLAYIFLGGAIFAIVFIGLIALIAYAVFKEKS